ncbi:DUF6912 family protein [Bogoriella caseilytica]|uniref:Uncharacterized protein n=1 Tax=Bogoriella caseilytica TaxID=56055 RepID=A0A3N2BEV8_9MICO|nr:hypothetical protein [Bogoriella caseilytica]ROR73755.1 hypothetical protein EDD31_2143 [Bogoriella caseilytica]
MRVYLPAIAADLASDHLTPRLAHSVTDDLARALPEEDEEGLELTATLAAADDSVRLLARAENEPPRRLVIAADLPAAVCQRAEGPDHLETAVEVQVPVAWNLVVAILLDAPEAEADVTAAITGDEAALDRAAEHDLLWFDVSERAALLAELRS